MLPIPIPTPAFLSRGREVQFVGLLLISNTNCVCGLFAKPSAAASERM